MRQVYSRRAHFEEKRNIRRAIFITVLTLGLVIALFFLGIPLVVKYAAFITEINSSSSEIKVNDNTPPPPPRLDTVAEHTNQPGIDINGTSESGSTVVILHNHSEKEVLTNKSGRFSLNIELKPGKNTISAYAMDTHDNKSYETNEIQIDYDTNPPELTVSSPANNSNFYGSLKKQLTITGKTEKEAIVKVNERLVILESEGNFNYVVNLVEGQNNFTVKAVDKAGNATEVSLSVTYYQ